MKNVAVVGATGAVGQELLSLLEARNFPVGRLLPLASSRSAGSTVSFRGERLMVQEATPEAFAGMDLVFFAATGLLSRELAPAAARAGAVVIDKSSTWRMDPEVPLVVPEVNPEDLRRHKGIIASPNCTTIGLVMALKPLHNLARITRVIVTTMQAVSGTGKEAIEELEQQVRAWTEGHRGELPHTVYKRQIAFNVLPYAETFTENLYTTEEMKLSAETRKIMGLPDLPVTMTCTRVPVFVGHSESVLVEFERKVTPAEAREALSRFPGVRVVDDPLQFVFPTAIDAAGTDDTLVGRIREDLTNEKGLWLWIVSDNLRKGAATNAVQIAEKLLEMQLI
ncbi:aspartate-semialdehyde dehydrogenase [Symbiobacterium thermophilum]|uniref:Aspartate-semialdehyde dehydrogenase n=1 Tax=Symbiobacterium thermophilum TaxID=2734 RepID=A0A953IEL9_SYMTR|nr:aspartate-semialdehyde dehydrogenase [Symbiobacterium thermophilum]MBY6277000.1 aspartate-semialdehyde dehydrogenase [Symbiobacterium thermophilum]